MNPEIPLLEDKLEQLRKKLDMALIQGDYIAANKNEILGQTNAGKANGMQRK